jgi:hypothetical protein
VRDSVLTIAESAASLRAQLKAANGHAPPALDVGSAPLPAGDGELVAGFEVRADEVALYRALRDVWLPLYALTRAPGGQRPLCARDALPPVEVAARHLGKVRGVLRRRGNALVYQSTGTAGGPVALALLAAWGPMFSGSWPIDLLGETSRLADQVMAKKLAAVTALLERWQQEKRALPATLAELYAQGHFADDALLMPADDAAEAVTLAGAGGGKRTARSSFAYVPAGVEIDVGPGPTRVVLIARAPRDYGRLMVGADGAVCRCYGDASSQPLDELLAGKKPASARTGPFLYFPF